jgi:hypothetical protein
LVTAHQKWKGGALGAPGVLLSGGERKLRIGTLFVLATFLIGIVSNREIHMRRLMPVMLLLPLALAACGTTKRTTIVNAPSDKTVVVQPNGDVVVKREDDRDRR